MDLSSYATLVFDCDGVLLDSNRIKTEAFYHAALPYGEAAAVGLVDYHVAHGGISRYRKFAHLLQHIVGDAQADPAPLLASYAAYVMERLRSCPVAEGLEALRARTAHARWMIVSGGDQAELRALFAARGLDTLFDGGIFGSPDTKDVILARAQAEGTLASPALFLGDSRYDHEAATRAGLDFVFLHGWSEFHDWRAYQAQHGFPAHAALAELLC